MTGSAERRIDASSLTGGLIMIAIGVLFLLSRLDFTDFGFVVRRFWPVILIVIGAPKLFSRETVWSGLWLITVGIWLQVSHLGMFDLTYASSWPLLLIALGAGMVLRSLVDARWPRTEQRS